MSWNNWWHVTLHKTLPVYTVSLPSQEWFLYHFDCFLLFLFLVLLSIRFMYKQCSKLPPLSLRLRLHVSGYPDVRDPDIFGAFTRVGLERFWRLHVSRHPDAFYAAYSLCVGEIHKCFFFGQVACLQTLFHFFLSFCWCLLAWPDDKVKVCLVSLAIDYKTQR